MAIDPRIPSVPGDFGGVAARLNDLDRRLRELALQVGQVPAGAIQGTQIGSDSITSANIAANAITASEISAGAIYAGSIQAGAVTASSIAANAVTANAIAANSIYTNAIQANAVTAAQIAAGTITAAQIATGTITATQIAAGTITATQIAADSITASQIAANAITASELAANAVYANAIQANAVTANAIAANSIYTGALQAAAVDATKINVTTLSSISSNMGAITAGTITGGTIQTATSGSRVVMDSLGLRGYALNGTTKVFEINAGSGVASFTGVANIDAASVIPGGTVTVGTMPGDRIVSASIQTLQLAAGAVVANTIAAGAVTAGKLTIAALDSSGNIAAGAVGNTQLTSNSVTTNNIVAGTILAADIAAGTITGNEIAASTITANKLSVTTLSAISADLGTITAGTITGGLIRTAASGARVELSGASPIGLKKYDASGNVTVRIGQTEGLSLLASTTSTVSLDRRLTWARADTSSVADIQAYSTGSDATTIIESTATSTVVPSILQLRAGAVGSSTQAQLNVEAIEVSGSPTVDVGVTVMSTLYGSKSVVILNEAGASSFVQKTDTTARAAFSFSNGWRAYLGGTGGAGSFGTNVGYFKDGSGVVHLEGLLDKNGGSWVGNDVILTLPVGFRPPSARMFRPEISPDGLGARVDLNTSGQLILVGGGATNPVGYLSLDGISFSTV